MHVSLVMPGSVVVFVLWLFLFFLLFLMFLKSAVTTKQQAFLLGIIATGVIVGVWLFVCSCYSAYLGTVACMFGYLIGGSLMLVSCSLAQFVLRKRYPIKKSD